LSITTDASPACLARALVGAMSPWREREAAYGHGGAYSTGSAISRKRRAGSILNSSIALSQRRDRRLRRLRSALALDWSIVGEIDCVTGDLEATITSTDVKTGQFIHRLAAR
jgi:hypothetical protein